MVTDMPDNPRNRIDAFPYRHRLTEVMGSPVVVGDPQSTLARAAGRMLEAKVSSLLLLDADGRPVSIFTEHDLLRAIAKHGAGVLEERLGDHASSPVVSLPSDAFVHRAIGRMDRLGLRHLAVVDPAGGQAVGVVSARGLLKQRAGRALALGDAIAVAESAADLGAVNGELPALAGALVAEGIDARRIAALVGSVIRDISARAAELAAQTVTAEQGPAPARWCYLVLGSAGRGESQLIPDQDNALVHDRTEADDRWFAALGERASDILDAAGIPYCKGKVMASNPAWRGSLDQWRRRIDGWVETPTPEGLLSVDIFYDFQPVYGDRSLAAKLRDYATTAGRSRPFLIVLSRELASLGSALNVFGGFRTEEGRLDLKRCGLLPVVSGARVLALSIGAGVTPTAERLRLAQEAGIVTEADASMLEEAQRLFLERILDQQSRDIAEGVAPTVRIDVRRLPPHERRRLRKSLRDVAVVSHLVENALATGN